MRFRFHASAPSMLVLLLCTACSLDEATGPVPAIPLDPLPVLPPLLAAAPHATPLGENRLEMAPLSANSTLDWRTMGMVPDSTGFRVDVRGNIRADFNPEWWPPFCGEGGYYARYYPALCSTSSYSFHGKTYGPAGASDGSLRVALRLRRRDGTFAHLALYIVQGDSSRAVGWGYGSGTIEVMRQGRDGWDNYCGPYGKDPCRRIERYAYDGFQDVKVTTLGPLTVRPLKSNVPIGDSIRFELDPGGAALGGTYAWQWVPGDTFPVPRGTNWTSATRVERSCEAKPTCALLPPYNSGGRVYVSGFRLDGITWPGPQAVSEIVTVGRKKVTVSLVEALPPLPSESFTSRAGENEVRLTATVSDPARGGEVQWEVRDDPGDAVESGRPSASTPGLSSSFSVPSPPSPRSRWPKDHPGGLERKALAYRIRAYLVDQGDTIWSDRRTVRQTKIDVARQEYIDFGKARVPAREEWGTHSTPSFSASELNSGDYDIFLAHERMRTGIEQVRAEAKAYFERRGKPFSGLTVTSAYRNPVHQHVHLGNNATGESSHFYGLATDVRIRSQSLPAEVLFTEFYRISKRVRPAACYEPENVVRAAGGGNLTHSHFDWRAGSCPPRW